MESNDKKAKKSWLLLELLMHIYAWLPKLSMTFKGRYIVKLSFLLKKLFSYILSEEVKKNDFYSMEWGKYL